jgi:hypothetical protein
LQWLYEYVVKVCSQYLIFVFGRMLQMFSSRYCICFSHTLQVFYLDVAYIFPMATHVFLVFHCKCFNCFKRMLQVFHLNIAKVDPVLHML